MNLPLISLFREHANNPEFTPLSFGPSMFSCVMITWGLRALFWLLSRSNILIVATSMWFVATSLIGFSMWSVVYFEYVSQGIQMVLGLNLSKSRHTQTVWSRFISSVDNVVARTSHGFGHESTFKVCTPFHEWNLSEMITYSMYVKLHV